MYPSGPNLFLIPVVDEAQSFEVLVYSLRFMHQFDCPAMSQAANRFPLRSGVSKDAWSYYRSNGCNRCALLCEHLECEATGLSVFR
jgi:hypothetical protein